MSDRDAWIVWVVHPIDDGRKAQRGTVRQHIDDGPCPCITAYGIGAAPRHRAWIETEPFRQEYPQSPEDLFE